MSDLHYSLLYPQGQQRQSGCRGTAQRYPLFPVCLAALLLLLALTASGCGFRLRGALDLPPQLQTVYIKTNRAANMPPSGLEQVLANRLKTNGVDVTTDLKQATAILEILNESESTRTLAASRQGQSRLNTLTYQVNYQVVLPDGKVLVPEATATATRDILYPEAAVLARDQGVQLVRREMESDIARTILRRVATVASQ